MTTTTAVSADRLAVEASALADAARRAGDPAGEQRFRGIAADCRRRVNERVDELAERARSAVVYEVRVHQSPYTELWVAVASADGHTTATCYGPTRERAVASAMRRIDDLVAFGPA